MDWLKENDGEIELVSEEIKLVPEVQALLALGYNKGPKDADGRKRYRCKNELTYLYLVYSNKSPYKDYSESERIEEAKRDCKFDASWKPSAELKAAIDRYQAATPNRIQRLLKTTERFIDKFEKYLNSIDLNERTAAQGLVYKATDVMATLERLPRLAETLFELERQAKLGVISKITSKGDHEVGWTAINGNKRNSGVGDNATTEGGDSEREVQ